MVRHQRVNRSIGQCDAQGIAVALLAQRRIEAHAAIEVPNVQIGQVQRIDADIAAHRQPLGLGLAHQFDASSAADAAQMHAGARGTHQLQNGVQSNRLCRYGNTAQTQTGGQRTAGGHTLAQVHLLGPQPDWVAKGAGVLQGALQYLRIGQWNFGLAKTHAAGIRQLLHGREHLASQRTRERAQRQHTRATLQLGTVMQHFHQTSFVEHRRGVGRTHQGGDATSRSRGALAAELASPRATRLTQACTQVHQTGHHDATSGIHHLVRHKVVCYIFNSYHRTIGEGYIGFFIKTTGRIDDAATLDQYLHASFPATMLITAMRTAIPNVTCGRITL